MEKEWTLKAMILKVLILTLYLELSSVLKIHLVAVGEWEDLADYSAKREEKEEWEECLNNLVDQEI